MDLIDYISNDTILNSLVTLAIITNHPLNSDYHLFIIPNHQSPNHYSH